MGAHIKDGWLHWGVTSRRGGCIGMMLHHGGVIRYKLEGNIKEVWLYWIGSLTQASSTTYPVPISHLLRPHQLLSLTSGLISHLLRPHQLLTQALLAIYSATQSDPISHSSATLVLGPPTLAPHSLRSSAFHKKHMFNYSPDLYSRHSPRR